MRPIDPRLLRVATAARVFLIAHAGVSLVQAAAIIAFAVLTGAVIGDAIWGRPLDALLPTIGCIVLAVVVRAVCAWGSDAAAHASAAATKAQLRARALAALSRGTGTTSSPAAVATSLGRGLDALDGYFGLALPQIVATAIATPIIVLALFLMDPFTGIVVVICLPLIPVFMVLIGLATSAAQSRQWDALQRLNGAFLDTLEGLPTLKIFRRDQRASRRIRQVTDEYRTRTMKVLRITFVSSFTLELAASLSVALVAVSIGIRLIGGDIDLGLAFAVLILAPEAFIPVRMVGAAFHASTEGLEAARDVLDLIDDADASSSLSSTATTTTTTTRADPGDDPGIVRIHGRAARVGTGVSPVDLRLAPGQIGALLGESGVGKTSLVRALLGFTPLAGSATLGGRPLTRDDIAWAPQASADALIEGTVFENVALGSREDDATTRERVGNAMRLADALGIPQDTPVRPASSADAGVSGGQAQRIVLARAIRRVLDGAPVLIADEPTSALDTETETRVIAGLRELADAGAVVVVVTHRRALAHAADEVDRMVLA